MIFVATGTQFPFDRLVTYMDEWAENNENNSKRESDHESVFIQLGNGEYLPQHTQWQRFMALDAYNEKIKQASVFISHAGMGNIITAKDHGIPIIVINRQASLGEHRNDHQQEGLVWMDELEGVYAAATKEALYALLDRRETLQAKKNNTEFKNDISDVSDATSLNHLVTYLKSVL